jgi:hypothetical protein
MSSQSVVMPATDTRTGAPQPAGRATWTTRLLLLIDRRQARIFKVRYQDGVPQQVIPYDPYGFRRGGRLSWSPTDGEVQGVSAKFREAIATTLRGSEQVLVLANGSRADAVVAQLTGAFKGRHPDLYRRLLGSMVTDERELDADRLLATVREFTGISAAGPTD